MAESNGVIDECLVQTTYGPVHGAKRTSFLGAKFFSFQSIPYAKPPIGELRFKVSKNHVYDDFLLICGGHIQDPLPPDAWTTPLDATRPPIASLYMDAKGAVSPNSSEDCLVLNVYTKQVSHIGFLAREVFD